MNKVVIAALLASVLAGCAQNIESSNGQAQWDFDHNVQFRETKREDGTYHIEVIPNSKAPFSTLSTFLLRRSIMICRSYGFKLELLEGIEEFNDRRSFPNMIFGSLAANLECPVPQEK